jgi:transposase
MCRQPARRPRDPRHLRQREQPQDRARQAFLAKHANVQIHYTPTYSSWLNQVENWFSRIQRDVISRGIFTSVKDLDKKLMRYIRQYNKNPKPLKWKYDNPNRRITPPILLIQWTSTPSWLKASVERG